MSPEPRHTAAPPRGEGSPSSGVDGEGATPASTAEALQARSDTLQAAARELEGGLAEAERLLRRRPHRRNAVPAETERVAGDGDHRRSVLVWLPVLSLVAAVGVLLCAGADALSRSTISSNQALFWLGVLAIYAPIVARLWHADAARGERAALVVLLGAALYLVKVVRDPFAFTFADELSHMPNANAILQTHELFHDNPILPATARYPGLESLTAALADTSGLSIFAAGLVVIGAARLVMMLSLFLVFERVSKSSRIAGLATALYAANANFVFFDAQFSYESLGLPLLLLALFAVVEWRSEENGAPWSFVAFTVTAAVVVTHHMSSYALTVLLAAYSVVAYAVDRNGKNPWRFALFAAAATAVWLSTVATATAGYLRPVFLEALRSTFDTLAGESAPRQLFASSGESGGVPLVERAIAVMSIVLIAAGVVASLGAVLGRWRREPLVLVFVGASIALFGVLALRFAPGAWETANRASEFLFVGVGFLLAVALVSRARVFDAHRVGAVVVAACAAVVFAGGVIAGWSPAERLTKPYRVRADGRTIEPVGRELARWATARLGRGRTYAASDSNARLLAAYANGNAHFGHSPYVEGILQTPTLPRWQRDALREHHLRYVVVDRRRRSFDNIAGYAFGVRTPPARRDKLLPVAVAEKFDRAGASRIYDAGVVRVYEMTPTWWARGR